MIEERYIELMNQEIDGANSPEESADLQAYLSANPEAQSYYSDLLELEDTFREIARVHPPRDLRRAILAQIGTSGEAAEQRGFLSRAPGAFRVRPRFAWAFAAGLVVGIGLFAALSRLSPGAAPEEIERLYGTLAETGTAGPFAAAEPVTFDLPGGTGSIRVRGSGNVVLAEVRLSTDTEVRILLEFAENMRFDGFRALDSGDHTIRVAGSQAEFTHSGVGGYAVILRDDSESWPPIRVRAFAAGQLLFEKEVRPGAE